MTIQVGIRRAAAVAAVGAVLAACTGPPPAPPADPPSPAAAPPAGLFVVTDAADRSMVIDGRGFVVYRYDGDATGPSRSACTGDCARRWPPVPWSAQLRLVGIDRQLVGRLDRPDGSAQVTLAGWPLYGYSGDRLPGEVSGSGLDGAWWRVGPRGAKLP